MNRCALRYVPFDAERGGRIRDFRKKVGRSGFEPLKSKDSGFTVRPIWPLWNLPWLCCDMGAPTPLTCMDEPQYEPEKGLEPPTR
jgi:hypothetical protein